MASDVVTVSERSENVSLTKRDFYTTQRTVLAALLMHYNMTSYEYA